MYLHSSNILLISSLEFFVIVTLNVFLLVRVGDHNLLLESSEFMLSQVKMEKTQLQRQVGAVVVVVVVNVSLFQVWEGQRERAGLEHQLKMLRQELADKDTDIADIQAAKSGKIKKNRSESS